MMSSGLIKSATAGTNNLLLMLVLVVQESKHVGLVVLYTTTKSVKSTISHVSIRLLTIFFRATHRKAVRPAWSGIRLSVCPSVHCTLYAGFVPNRSTSPNRELTKNVHRTEGLG